MPLQRSISATIGGIRPCCRSTSRPSEPDYMTPVVGTPSLQRLRWSLKSGGAMRLLSKLLVLVTVASVMCGRALASPVTWAEVGDAGELPGTAQVPTGVGTLDAITGTIGFHDVDLYEIFLTGSR